MLISELSGTSLLMSDRIFWPRLCLAEEAFILGSLPWNIMPKSLPLFINVDLYHTFIHPQIYEVSSDWIPSPIHSTRPNTPTYIYIYIYIYHNWIHFHMFILKLDTANVYFWIFLNSLKKIFLRISFSGVCKISILDCSIIVRKKKVVYWPIATIILNFLM